ncbi:MAG: hypothetical protein ABFE13_25650 [Phycisphaerales bacterium]
MAHDLTVDKFSHLPVDVADGPRRKPEGPDCCYYYRAFFDHVTAKLKANPPANSIEAEMLATRSLRALVARHFYLSCLESRRRTQRLVRRHIWRIDGHALYLWLPLEMPGRQCRAWLETNIPDVDPSRCGEQERVQGIVDRMLGRPRVISIHAAHAVADSIAAKMDPVASMIREEIGVSGLAGTVAEEKADGIELQRPAVRGLGKDKLRRLIHEVFDGLVRGDYQADRIASSYGLSEATFSRFAGIRWKVDGVGPAAASVPDLWRNTAQTLARHPDFVTAAKHAGVWKQVTEVLDTHGAGWRREHG